MSDNQEYSNEDRAALEKLKRDHSDRKMVYDAAERGLKEYFRAVKKDEKNKQNQADKIIGITKGRRMKDLKPTPAGLHNDREGPVTGYEPRPWEESD